MIRALMLCVVLLMMAMPVFADEITYDGGGRRDPFIPVEGGSGVKKAGSDSGMALEGIIYDPSGQSLAIMAGDPYRVGDSIGGTKIVQIRKDHVMVEVNGEQKTLWIREEEQL
ncbi:MAG TPA: hypothetical protein PLH16_06785 [Candidatus Omnitrophota bacterium]|nr:hypothetical protein [Candidatus Omnitrophota bacterium]